MRGQNYLPAFTDETKLLSTDYYAAYSTLHQSDTHMRMYSDGHFKLVRDFKNEDRDEFCDLTNDPQETTNLLEKVLTKAHLKTIASFDEILINKMRETNDPVFAIASRK